MQKQTIVVPGPFQTELDKLTKRGAPAKKKATKRKKKHGAPKPPMPPMKQGGSY